MNGVPIPTVGPYLVAKLRTLDSRLQEVALRVFSASRDADAVHDLRVALRRTRTLLEVGSPVLGRFRSDEVRAALRDLQRVTGALRDEEVLLELVEALHLAHPNVPSWLKIRGRNERRLRRALVRKIESGELDRGRRMIDALLAFRVDPSHDRRLTKFVRRAVMDARRRVERRRVTHIDDPVALHRLRIAYKRLRYVVEAFADTLPSELTALAPTAARLQNRLGALHDVDVVASCVGRARALPDDARRELLSALARVRDERMASYAREIAPLAYAHDRPRHASGTEALRKTSIR